MASTLTRRNAEISFKALSLGASDYIPKPESTRETAAAETFHHDLIQKIRSLGAKVRRAVPASCRRRWRRLTGELRAACAGAGCAAAAGAPRRSARRRRACC